MLELSRKNGEKLQLVIENNEVIAIYLTSVLGKQFKLSFDAPSSRRHISNELLSLDVTKQDLH